MRPLRSDPRRTSWGRCLGASLLAAFLLAGCSGSQRAAPVDTSRAHEALKAALEGWKKGDSPSALQSGTPSITVQDLDWLAGARLVDYQVDGEGRPVEANLYVPVKLTLRTAKGKEVNKKVNYIVGTSPILTVFRDFR
ncbi:MAG: hypothetical protein P4L84_11620 [Isosphaeraceae bacterium]|nr:hypothetical protein [Isosphaeraceae bacterium]